MQLVKCLAQQVEPKSRRSCLDSLLSMLPQTGGGREETSSDAHSTLLAEISRLHKKVHRRLESIEDGSCWEDPDEDTWEDDFYDEDTPPPLSNDQVDELKDFFHEANHTFLMGDMQGARKLVEHG